MLLGPAPGFGVEESPVGGERVDGLAARFPVRWLSGTSAGGLVRFPAMMMNQLPLCQAVKTRRAAGGQTNLLKLGKGYPGRSRRGIREGETQRHANLSRAVPSWFVQTPASGRRPSPKQPVRRTEAEANVLLVLFCLFKRPHAADTDAPATTPPSSREPTSRAIAATHTG